MRWTLIKKDIARDEDGTSAIEFAFTVPVFIMLVFGIMNLGLAFYSGFTVQWAIEKASRQYFIDDTMTAADLQTVVDERLERIGFDLAVVVDVDTEAGSETDVAVVSSDFTYTMDIPLLDSFPITFTTRTLVPRPRG